MINLRIYYRPLSQVGSSGFSWDSCHAFQKFEKFIWILKKITSRLSNIIEILYKTLKISTHDPPLLEAIKLLKEVKYGMIINL